MNRRTRTLSLTLTGTFAATLLVAAPAHAGWDRVLSWKGGGTQACRAPMVGGVEVRARAHNTGGNVALSAGMNVVRNGKPGDRGKYTRAVAPGEISDPVSMRFDRGDQVSLSVGGHFGFFDQRIMRISRLPRC